ncbi:hypothetical protein DPMN_036112 [Dreissena polymorpha]|uniref:Uncharacterized protein n=1 Tax=Dreissena polymorpha TaxID=45954 RepID=A0A9D4MBZ0_DREPO|nr:hypothetical protein DPMN_036112 [Dreissena polymorpha]
MGLMPYASKALQRPVDPLSLVSSYPVRYSLARCRGFYSGQGCPLQDFTDALVWSHTGCISHKIHFCLTRL